MGYARLQELVAELKKYRGADCQTRNFRRKNALDILERVQLACLRNGVPKYAAEVARTMLDLQTLLDISIMLMDTPDENVQDKEILLTICEKVDFTSLAAEPPSEVRMSDDSVVTQTVTIAKDFEYWSCEICCKT